MCPQHLYWFKPKSVAEMSTDLDLMKSVTPNYKDGKAAKRPC